MSQRPPVPPSLQATQSPPTTPKSRLSKLRQMFTGAGKRTSETPSKSIPGSPPSRSVTDPVSPSVKRVAERGSSSPLAIGTSAPVTVQGPNEGLSFTPGINPGKTSDSSVLEEAVFFPSLPPIEQRQPPDAPPSATPVDLSSPAGAGSLSNTSSTVSLLSTALQQPETRPNSEDSCRSTPSPQGSPTNESSSAGSMSPASSTTSLASERDATNSPPATPSPARSQVITPRSESPAPALLEIICAPIPELARAFKAKQQGKPPMNGEQFGDWLEGEYIPSLFSSDKLDGVFFLLNAQDLLKKLSDKNRIHILTQLLNYVFQKCSDPKFTDLVLHIKPIIYNCLLGLEFNEQNTVLLRSKLTDFYRNIRDQHTLSVSADFLEDDTSISQNLNTLSEIVQEAIIDSARDNLPRAFRKLALSADVTAISGETASPLLLEVKNIFAFLPEDILLELLSKQLTLCIDLNDQTKLKATNEILGLVIQRLKEFSTMVLSTEKVIDIITTLQKLTLRELMAGREMKCKDSVVKGIFELIAIPPQLSESKNRQERSDAGRQMALYNGNMLQLGRFGRACYLQLSHLISSTAPIAAALPVEVSQTSAAGQAAQDSVGQTAWFKRISSLRALVKSIPIPAILAFLQANREREVSESDKLAFLHAFFQVMQPVGFDAGLHDVIITQGGLRPEEVVKLFQIQGLSTSAGGAYERIYEAVLLKAFPKLTAPQQAQVLNFYAQNQQKWIIGKKLVSLVSAAGNTMSSLPDLDSTVAISILKDEETARSLGLFLDSESSKTELSALITKLNIEQLAKLIKTYQGKLDIIRRLVASLELEPEIMHEFVAKILEDNHYGNFGVEKTSRDENFFLAFIKIPKVMEQISPEEASLLLCVPYIESDDLAEGQLVAKIRDDMDILGQLIDYYENQPKIIHRLIEGLSFGLESKEALVFLSNRSVALQLSEEDIGKLVQTLSGEQVFGLIQGQNSAFYKTNCEMHAIFWRLAFEKLSLRQVIEIANSLTAGDQRQQFVKFVNERAPKRLALELLWKVEWIKESTNKDLTALSKRCDLGAETADFDFSSYFQQVLSADGACHKQMVLAFCDLQNPVKDNIKMVGALDTGDVSDVLKLYNFGKPKDGESPEQLAAKREYLKNFIKTSIAKISSAAAIELLQVTGIGDQDDIYRLLVSRVSRDDLGRLVSISKKKPSDITKLLDALAGNLPIQSGENTDEKQGDAALVFLNDLQVVALLRNTDRHLLVAKLTPEQAFSLISDAHNKNEYAQVDKDYIQGMWLELFTKLTPEQLIEFASSLPEGEIQQNFLHFASQHLPLEIAGQLLSNPRWIELSSSENLVELVRNLHGLEQVERVNFFAGFDFPAFFAGLHEPAISEKMVLAFCDTESPINSQPLLLASLKPEQVKTVISYYLDSDPPKGATDKGKEFLLAFVQNESVREKISSKDALRLLKIPAIENSILRPLLVSKIALEELPALIGTYSSNPDVLKRLIDAFGDGFPLNEHNNQDSALLAFLDNPAIIMRLDDDYRAKLAGKLSLDALAEYLKKDIYTNTPDHHNALWSVAFSRLNAAQIFTLVKSITDEAHRVAFIRYINERIDLPPGLAKELLTSSEWIDLSSRDSLLVLISNLHAKQPAYFNQAAFESIFAAAGEAHRAKMIEVFCHEASLVKDNVDMISVLDDAEKIRLGELRQVVEDLRTKDPLLLKGFLMKLHPRKIADIFCLLSDPITDDNEGLTPDQDLIFQTLGLEVYEGNNFIKKVIYELSTLIADPTRALLPDKIHDARERLFNYIVSEGAELLQDKTFLNGPVITSNFVSWALQHQPITGKKTLQELIEFFGGNENLQIFISKNPEAYLEHFAVSHFAEPEVQKYCSEYISRLTLSEGGTKKPQRMAEFLFKITKLASEDVTREFEVSKPAEPVAPGAGPVSSELRRPYNYTTLCTLHTMLQQVKDRGVRDIYEGDKKVGSISACSEQVLSLIKHKVREDSMEHYFGAGPASEKQPPRIIPGALRDIGRHLPEISRPGAPREAFGDDFTPAETDYLTALTNAPDEKIFRALVEPLLNKSIRDSFAEINRKTKLAEQLKAYLTTKLEAKESDSLKKAKLRILKSYESSWDKKIRNFFAWPFTGIALFRKRTESSQTADLRLTTPPGAPIAVSLVPSPGDLGVYNPPAPAAQHSGVGTSTGPVGAAAQPLPMVSLTVGTPPPPPPPPPLNPVVPPSSAIRLQAGSHSPESTSISVTAATTAAPPALPPGSPPPATHAGISSALGAGHQPADISVRFRGCSTIDRCHETLRSANNEGLRDIIRDFTFDFQEGVSGYTEEQKAALLSYLIDNKKYLVKIIMDECIKPAFIEYALQQNSFLIRPPEVMKKFREAIYSSSNPNLIWIAVNDLQKLCHGDTDPKDHFKTLIQLYHDHIQQVGHKLLDIFVASTEPSIVPSQGCEDEKKCLISDMLDILPTLRDEFYNTNDKRELVRFLLQRLPLSNLFWQVIKSTPDPSKKAARINFTCDLIIGLMLDHDDLVFENIVQIKELVNTLGLDIFKQRLWEELLHRSRLPDEGEFSALQEDLQKSIASFYDVRGLPTSISSTERTETTRDYLRIIFARSEDEIDSCVTNPVSRLRLLKVVSGGCLITPTISGDLAIDYAKPTVRYLIFSLAKHVTQRDFEMPFDNHHTPIGIGFFRACHATLEKLSCGFGDLNPLIGFCDLYKSIPDSPGGKFLRGKIAGDELGCRYFALAVKVLESDQLSTEKRDKILVMMTQFISDLQESSGADSNQQLGLVIKIIKAFIPVNIDLPTWNTQFTKINECFQRADISTLMPVLAVSLNKMRVLVSNFERSTNVVELKLREKLNEIINWCEYCIVLNSATENLPVSFEKLVIVCAYAIKDRIVPWEMVNAKLENMIRSMISSVTRIQNPNERKKEITKNFLAMTRLFKTFLSFPVSGENIPLLSALRDKFSKLLEMVYVADNSEIPASIRELLANTQLAGASGAIDEILKIMRLNKDKVQTTLISPESEQILGSVLSDETLESVAFFGSNPNIDLAIHCARGIYQDYSCCAQQGAVRGLQPR